MYQLLVFSSIRKHKRLCSSCFPQSFDYLSDVHFFRQFLASRAKHSFLFRLLHTTARAATEDSPFQLSPTRESIAFEWLSSRILRDVDILEPEADLC